VNQSASVCQFCGLSGFGCHDWPGPLICPDCCAERGDGPAAFDTWKARAVCELAGLAGWWPDAPRVLGFRWWREVPAPPAPTRWAYVDLDDLRLRARRWRPNDRGWAMLTSTKESLQ
jgi:hypothetical protein